MWDECSEESALSESSVVMSVVYSERIECWKELNWEELKSVQGTKCSIWDIVRQTKSKQVPSWDPRQHVECWGPFTEIESSRLNFQLSTPRDLVRWMGWTRHGKRVHTWKPSSLNSVSNDDFASNSNSNKSGILSPASKLSGILSPAFELSSTKDYSKKYQRLHT